MPPAIDPKQPGHQLSPLPAIVPAAAFEQLAATWPDERQRLADLVQQCEYGHLPPQPTDLRVEWLHTHRVAMYDNCEHRLCRVSGRLDGPFQFLLEVFIPNDTGRRPVLLAGDGCWRYVSEAVLREGLRRGYIMAVFNRLELAADPGDRDRPSGLFAASPGGSFGALAAWAWGYHRAIDALLTLDVVDPAGLVVTGHSRGGKAALLAGALDERIAVTNANGSGCGGGALYRWDGPARETLERITQQFPTWFTPGFAAFAGRETQLPIDQHMLLALVAPRALLLTEALGDLWANPQGTLQAYRAARPIFERLGDAEQLGLTYRGGVHRHAYEDFVALLDFADWRLRGLTAQGAFHPDPGPFSELAVPAVTGD